MIRKFYLYILLVIFYLVSIYLISLFIPYYVSVDNISTQVYPNAPYLSNKATYALNKRGFISSNSLHSSENPIINSNSFPSAVGLSDFRTHQATNSLLASRISSPSPVRQSLQPFVGVNSVVLSRRSSLSSVSSNNYASGYSFDDNNSFTNSTMQHSTQGGSAVLDPDNESGDTTNALSLNDDFLCWFSFILLYVLFRFVFKLLHSRKITVSNMVLLFSKKSLKRMFLLLFVLFIGGSTFSNNLIVSNVAVSSKDTVSKYRDIRFDIQWENSWRVTDGPANYDATWVFVKFSKDKGQTWSHARLHNGSHLVGTGTPAEFKLGLQSPGATYNSSSNPVLGVFLQRSEEGIGSFSSTGSTLRWYFGNDGVLNTDPVIIKVFAVEMVYVPQASFYVGDGALSEINGQFSDAADTSVPFLINSEAAITLGGVVSGNLASNNSVGMESSGLDDFSSTVTKLLPSTFPKGFNGFYIMKYELGQQQYVDFLNTLTRPQQASRTATSLVSGVTSVTNCYVMSNSPTLVFRNGVRCNASVDATLPINFYCDGNQNGIGGEADDGLAVACNFTKWADNLAYADWAGLRPMTELEYEKATRGSVVPIVNEYSWGSTSLNNEPISLANAGTYNEQLSTGFNYRVGNACYATTALFPVRVGVFASNINNTGRVSAGASFYGVMEMSGNLWERAVMTGSETGRAYTGNHGDGVVSANGNANQQFWPGTVAGEVLLDHGGLRGGAIEHVWQRLRVSDRYNASLFSDIRYQTRGVRVVRSFHP